MPTVQGTDLFKPFTQAVPGTGPYAYVGGGPFVVTNNPLHEGDPATVSSGGHLGYEITGSPTLGWRGFFWYIKSTAEPGGNSIFGQMWSAGFVSAAKLYWIPASNRVEHTVNDFGFSGVASTMDAWHWVEQIFDVGGTTHSIYTRLDGVDFTPESQSGLSATVMQYSEIGQSSEPHYAHAMWGTAASVTDWLGQPNTASVAWMGV